MKIEHIALYVKDLQATKSFYEKYFGAKSGDMYRNKRTGFSSYFLSFDSGARLEIMNVAQLCEKGTDGKREGYIHLAFSVGSKQGVDALTHALQADGYEVAGAPRTTGDGYYESCVFDPEGNLIEITV